MNSSYPELCPSCCHGCFGGTQVQWYTQPELGAAYSLENLLAAGTVVVNLNPDVQESVCNHTHAEDGWHPFQNNLFKGHLTVEDASVCREIEFLVQHRFISVTYRLGSLTRVFLRIYIIPFDLANVQGKLRVRKEVILGPARRYLKTLLPKIVQAADNWNGDGFPGHYPSLILSAKVASYFPREKGPQYILVRIIALWQKFMVIYSLRRL
jgi:hypothetical protein